MKVKKGFELQTVCDEYLIIPTGIDNIDFCNIISMNSTAAFLWEKVAAMDSFNVETLVSLLLEEYEVEESIAREDCHLIIERWKETGIIEE